MTPGIALWVAIRWNNRSLLTGVSAATIVPILEGLPAI